LIVRRDVCDQVWALRSSCSAPPQPVGLTGFAGLAAKTGKHRMALRLSGAAEAYRDTYETGFPEPNRAHLQSWLALALTTVGAAADLAAWR
jgi:hypothetical protein